MGITLNLGFGTVKIYGRYIIAEVNEGVVLGHEHHDVLEEIAETYYHNTTFVYISHRIHSYAVDPMIYVRTSKLTNLVGFAYVSEHTLPLTNAQLEKAFLKKPNFMGRNLENAIQWAIELTEKEQHLVLQ
ncbi:hypothetical protein K8352_13125 [Flavobacteriaceae bacterium F89]|uniref:Uncharacterized protein n=1 Tax=Cerina litoralis TaxID=2874477 RepID=A0AAE3EXQ1_9FLAO|nr:hypothetical protein [Cerina litoralis]MCG2461696.1 hypothetical protein [Cerina litoralis]